MSQIDRNATIDIQLQAHTMLARAFTKVGGVTPATQEYGKVRGMWKDPAAIVKKVQDAGGDERKLAKMLTAVGEAMFFFAELKKKDVDKIKFPEYRGAGNRDDVLKHINTKVGDWVKKKMTAIADARRSTSRS